MKRPDLAACARILDEARARGERVLVEPQGFPLLSALGIEVPRFRVLRGPAEVAAMEPLDGARVVVKVASATLLHRSGAGGVAFCDNTPGAITAVLSQMERAIPAEGRSGYTVSELFPHGAALGAELILGLRHTSDFGPVVTLGPGGIHAELHARELREAIAILPAAPMGSPDEDRALVTSIVERLPVARMAHGGMRGEPERFAWSALVDCVQALRALGHALCPGQLTECEINPLAVGDRLCALDVLVKLPAHGDDSASVKPAPPRPLHKIAHLLAPRSVALVGVSESKNPGRIILDNLLSEGFPRDHITIVKPGAVELAGCRCVPDLSSLPGRVDLVVLAIGAAQIPAALAAVIGERKAESVVVIPGGLEEKEGGGARLVPLREALFAARASDWQGPVVNGGNCLGVRSRAGRIDTLFIPREKLGRGPSSGPLSGAASRVALVSQSGAFAIVMRTRLPWLDPAYVVTCGNQFDLTVGDYLAWLADDPGLDVYAVYLEGFRPGDGARFLEAARRIRARGARVILYRAGRTAEGAAASASHTASIAGDYAVTAALARQAGVVVAGSLDEFEDAVALAATLGGRRLGRRLGALSNAGFECVAIGDNLGRLSLARFSEGTVARLEALLRRSRLDSLVDVHDPLDLTPMADDATWDEAARALLDDPGVDVALLGNVPLTPAMQTLPAGNARGEDLAAEGAWGPRLIRLFREAHKPLVVVLHAGPLYDPLAAHLLRAGVPTFRAADRALRALDLLVEKTPSQSTPPG